MKDHEIRKLVNQLRDVAIKYHGAGQLREQIARVVRAHMLQAQPDDDGEPTDDERIMAIEGIHNCERCSDEGWVIGEMGIMRCTCNQGNPIFKIDLNSDFIKHVKAVSEKVRSGNPPAIPDCSAVAALTGIPMIPDGYVMVPKEPTEEILAVITEAIRAMRGSAATYARVLAAAPQPQNAPQNIPEIIPGWIPVRERMPGSQEWVIVFAKWANQQVLCWDDVQNRWTDFEDQSYYADMFTHWMPLPAGPKEEK